MRAGGAWQILSWIRLLSPAFHALDGLMRPPALHQSPVPTLLSHAG